MRHFLTKRSLASLGGVSALALGLIWLAPFGQAAADNRAEPSSSTTTTQPSTLLPVRAVYAVPVEGWQEELRFTGTLSPRRESPLGFERGGLLVEVAVDEGQVVQSHQVLARLDAERLDLQLAELRAERARQAAQLDELLAGPRRQTIEAARAALVEVQAQARRLTRETARQQELLEQGVSAEEVAEALVSQLAATQAREEAARQKLAELEAGTRSEQLDAQRAVVALADARIASLQLEIERSTLRAPFSGTVLIRHADEGRVVAAGTPVVHIQETANLEARIGVPADLAQLPSPGESVHLQVPDGVLEAKLRAVLPQVDPRTRTRTLLFDLPASALALPGASVAWTASEFRAGKGHQVPSSSLTSGRRGLWAVLLVVEDENGVARMQRQEVQVLHTDTDQVVVLGLRDSDLVLAAATDRVVPGQAVRPELSNDESQD